MLNIKQDSCDLCVCSTGCKCDCHLNEKEEGKELRFFQTYTCSICGLDSYKEHLNITDCSEEFKKAIMSLFNHSKKRRYGRLHKKLEKIVSNRKEGKE